MARIAQGGKRVEKNFPGSGKVYRVVEPTVAYQLGVEGHGFYWPKVPLPGVHCPECRSVLDYTAFSHQVELDRKRDVACASLRTIVSTKFRDICLASGVAETDLIRIRDNEPKFELRPTRVVEVDWEASAPRFTRLCARCGQFECILRGEGLFLRGITAPLEDGIYRTDLIWGCRSMKTPEIIVGRRTMEQLNKAGFKNLYFWPIPYILLIRPSVPQGNLGHVTK